ncbi:MAG: hypothetical protein NY202_01290 [Mollicutes bacterium UO1]
MAYHQEEECGHKHEQPKIAIYFSPNQAGKEHADLTYGEKIKDEELDLEKDNQGQVYHQQENSKKDNRTN